MRIQTKTTMIALLAALSFSFLSCEDEKKAEETSLTSLLTQTSSLPFSGFPNDGSGEDEIPSGEPILLSITPTPDSIKQFSLTDRGYLPEGGSCNSDGVSMGYFQEGESVKVRQIEPTTSGQITVEAVFDRPVTSKSYRLDMRIGGIGIGGGSGTFVYPTRPNSNTIRFVLPFQHEFPGISRLSTDSPTWNADNEMSFSLAERPNDSPYGVGNEVLSWKYTEKFQAPYDNYNAKVSFICETDEASECYAKVKYRLPLFDNHALRSDSKNFFLSVTLLNPSNPSQIIGRGFIQAPDCYFDAKQNSSHVWYYEAKIKLNRDEALFTPQDLANGNYKVVIDNAIEFGLRINNAPYHGGILYKDSDIVRQ
ncbi:hypothetical protein AB3N59_01305 [Leptospira sp. WS92.C1]